MAADIHTGVDTATARLRLLVLQPTPFCNVDCSYCYLSNRGSAARMSLATLDLVCRRVFESAFLSRELGGGVTRRRAADRSARLV